MNGGVRSIFGRQTSTPGLRTAVALVVAAMISVQSGAAIAATVFSETGPLGAAWMRLCFAAVILGALARPRLRGRSRADLAAALALGGVSALLTASYFEAIARIPLGTATALEFLGPLTVAVAGARGLSAIVWPAVAAAGVLAITNPWTTTLDGAGVLFALVAAAAWGCYILLTQRVADRFAGLDGLAVSMGVAGLVTTPLGLPQAVSGATPRAVAVVALSALLLPVLAYAFEMVALRGLTTSSFGTLMSLEPAIGSVVGFVILSQTLSSWQGLGIALVCLAGAGAAQRGRRHPRAP